MQTDMQANREQYDDEIVIDLTGISQDYIRCLKRYWFQFLLLLLLTGAMVVAYLNESYNPSYTAKVTYAVNKTGDSGIEASLAKRLSGAVSSVASIGEFKDELLEYVGDNGVKGDFLITSSNMEGANLFTIYVNSNNYNTANVILNSLEKVYPGWASKSNGTVELELVDRSEASEVPTNPYSLSEFVLKGIAAGAALCILIATLYVLTIKTVRKESDMKTITSKSCITRIPEVKIKKRAKSTKEQLLISNKRIDWGFKQAIMSAQSRIRKQMVRKGQKVLLVSSTMPQEGKSVITVNMAQAFAENESKVLILDCDFRNPSIKKLLNLEENTKGLTDYFKKEAKLDEMIVKGEAFDILCTGTEKGEGSGILAEDKMLELMIILRGRYDYILIDTPPAHLFTDAALLGTYADAVLYIVRHDLATRKEIKEGISPFIQNGKLLGYLINRNPGGFSTYGKYGYSKYGHYGKYKRYINAEESSFDEEDTV